MKVDPSGIVTIGECELRLPGCVGLTPAPVMAILELPERAVAATVCRACLSEMIRLGEWEIPGAHVKPRFDIAVYDKNERLRLVVDVKDASYQHEGSTEQWATRIRRNLVRHAAVPIYVYFLLAVYPSPFYLWLPEDASDAPPRFSLDAQAQMPPGQESDPLTEYQQQIDAVSAWLTVLMDAPAEEGTPSAWLHESGLHEAIQGGRLVRRTVQAETMELQPA